MSLMVLVVAMYFVNWIDLILYWYAFAFVLKSIVNCVLLKMSIQLNIWIKKINFFLLT